VNRSSLGLAISQTELGPAFQAGLDYTSADLGLGLPAARYVGIWGTNVAFPNTGNDIELTISGGARLRALANRLTVDVGYVRYAIRASTRPSATTTAI
jgi:uncharacterized protein (TIGR02001 family)